jgi:hypothetical protein
MVVLVLRVVVLGLVECPVRISSSRYCLPRSLLSM